MTAGKGGLTERTRDNRFECLSLWNNGNHTRFVPKLNIVLHCHSKPVNPRIDKVRIIGMRRLLCECCNCLG